MDPSSGAGRRADLVRRGEVRAVARLISELEDGDPAALEVMRALAGSGVEAHVIGVTGPPGSGKSTLTDKLIREFRARGRRVGVVAVDPSSPFTGGAILGDRLRMNEHATDEGVFIRSLASRGRLGGLSKATGPALRVLAAAGYEVVIVETVGVGQSEVDVMRVADSVVLVSVPGLGDDIQAIKAGVMEIGDVFVVNKSDRDGADRVVREINAMLETARALKWRRAAPARASVDTLAGRRVSFGEASGEGGAAPYAGGAAGGAGHHRADALAAAAGGASEAGEDPHAGLEPLPPVLKTVAETGEGVAALADALVAHRAKLAASGELRERRREGARAEMRHLMAYRLLDALEGEEGRRLEDAATLDVVEGRTDPYGAAEELFAALTAREPRRI